MQLRRDSKINDICFVFNALFVILNDTLDEFVRGGVSLAQFAIKTKSFVCNVSSEKGGSFIHSNYISAAAAHSSIP